MAAEGGKEPTVEQERAKDKPPEEETEGRPTRTAKWSLLTAIVVMAIPFVPMIRWYTGSLMHGSRESRSLIEHAWWWFDEASFGPWVAPLLVVLGPPLVVLGTMLALPIRATKARRIGAILATIAAWIIVFLALSEVGEDIVFSWIRMPLPLAIQATAITVWAFTKPWQLTR